MLSCHPEPFSAFIADLQIPGTAVHLYRGPNAYACCLLPETAQSIVETFDKDNLYFLAGVRHGLQKRAADADVICRNMFTLDFDIRKELEKAGVPTTQKEMDLAIELVLQSLLDHPPYDTMRYAVASGNGLHIHYFGEHVRVNKEEWAAGMKDIFAEINAWCPYPCDTGCGNAGRIMRVPGSWNVKSGRLPVEVIIWMPAAVFPPMSSVQARGAHAMAKASERKQADLAEFAATHPDGGSDVIDLINRIPIEQVVSQLFAGLRVKAVKKDGGIRFADEKGVERGFFKHHQYNIIVHEGTALFPAPAGIGYNCLGLAKLVLGVETRAAVEWFCERSTPVREAQRREKDEWSRENMAKDVELVEQRMLTATPL